MAFLKFNKNIVGGNVDGEVIVHPDLLQHPRLLKAIVAHEKSHSKGYAWRDFRMDLHNDDLKGLKKEYWMFVASHPSCWASFLPIQKIEREWVFDPIMTLAWVGALAVAMLIGGYIL